MYKYSPARVLTQSCHHSADLIDLVSCKVVQITLTVNIVSLHLTVESILVAQPPPHYLGSETT